MNKVTSDIYIRNQKLLKDAREGCADSYLSKPLYVFLTRGEIHIHDSNHLSIHLKPKDKRLKDIITLMSKINIKGPTYGNELKIITVDPKMIGSATTGSHCSSFIRENWYLIPSLEYIGHVDYSGFTHYSFSYTMDWEYIWQKRGVRLLTSSEVDKFKKEHQLFFNY